ncbi:MAG: gliding motility-associated C-terminal domain-containing protein [Bacteroidota bacterium]
MKKIVFISFMLFALQSKAYWVWPPVAHTNTCIGDTTFFSLFDTTQLNAISWNFNDPSSGASNTSSLWEPTHLFTSIGSYTVSVIRYHSVLGIDTLTLNVVIEAPLFNIFSNDTALCFGSSISIDPSPRYTFEPFFGTSNYLWQDGSADSTFTATSAGIYWLSVTNGCGTLTDTMVISVLPPPVVSVNNIAICAGETAVLTATGAATYSWSVGATLTGINTASVTPLNTAVFTVTGTTAGCSGTASSTVTVKPLPVITVNSPSVCVGQSVGLTANGGTSYTWSAGAVSIGTNTATTNPLTTTTFTVIGTTAGCSNMATSTVTVNALPIVNVNDITICEGETANLVASGADVYSWSSGVISTAINTGVAMPVISTNYIVTGTRGGCSGTATSRVKVNKAPALSLRKDIVIEWGGATTLSAIGAGTFTWFPSEGLSCIDCPNPLANPSETTNYSVMVTDMHGCTTSAQVAVKVESAVYIPNAFTPDNNGLNDIFKPEIIDVHDFSFLIYDRAGEKMFETSNIEEGWNGYYKGELCKQDVYAYTIVFLDDAKSDYHVYNGKITLLR